MEKNEVWKKMRYGKNEVCKKGYANFDRDRSNSNRMKRLSSRCYDLLPGDDFWPSSPSSGCLTCSRSKDTVNPSMRVTKRTIIDCGCFSLLNA
jgi:hypothetical protein